MRCRACAIKRGRKKHHSRTFGGKRGADLAQSRSGTQRGARQAGRARSPIRDIKSIRALSDSASLVALADLLDDLRRSLEIARDCAGDEPLIERPLPVDHTPPCQNGRAGSQRGEKQQRPEQQNDHRAADGAAGPHRIGPGALVPPSLSASSREPSASVASAATVMAVPNAMAKVAATPAQNRPWVTAKTSTRMAPVQGLIPTENTTAIPSARRTARQAAAHRRYDRTPLHGAW